MLGGEKRGGFKLQEVEGSDIRKGEKKALTFLS